MTKPWADKSLPFLTGTTVATLLLAVCAAPLTAETVNPCTACIARIHNWAVKPGSPCANMPQGYQRDQCIWNQVNIHCVQPTPQYPVPPCSQQNFEADPPDCESVGCAFDPALWATGQKFCGWQCWGRLCEGTESDKKCYDKKKDTDECRNALVTSQCVECKCASSADW